MSRRYVLLALVAFGGYSLVSPILKVAMATIPSTTAVFMTNFVMVVILAGLMRYNGTKLRRYLRHPKLPYMVAWGVVLAVGLLAYYRALALGPVSVVVPIYGLFIALSSLIGVVAFGEAVTLRKVAGIACAVIAIALMSV